MDSLVLNAWRDGTTASLRDLLAADAVFSSPVADYPGRERAARVLGLIPEVLERMEPVDGWGVPGDGAVSFVASVHGRRLEGVLLERRDAAGAVTHVTLFLRPLKELRIAIGRMRVLLEADPS